jgi:nucleoid-associated protein YgaU
MTDQLDSILQQTGLKSTSFSSTSRYYGTETTSLETDKGETVIYLRRRFVPQTDRFSVISQHTVKQGERLDNITNQYLGDPEQFWRICDANGALDPDELTERAGHYIKITLPEGIAGF